MDPEAIRFAADRQRNIAGWARGLVTLAICLLLGVCLGSLVAAVVVGP